MMNLSSLGDFPCVRLFPNSYLILTPISFSMCPMHFNFTACLFFPTYCQESTAIVTSNISYASQPMLPNKNKNLLFYPTFCLASCS